MGWHVLTPPFDACDDHDECGRPIGSYEARDYIEIEAATRRDAVQLAVKVWLAEWSPHRWSRYPNYCIGRKQDGLCPWTGALSPPTNCKGSSRDRGTKL